MLLSKVNSRTPRLPLPEHELRAAVEDGKIGYATAMGETNTQGGWRENKIKGGILMEVPSGEIVTRGPTVMKGYLNRPEETAEALRGGWFHTGDMGRIEDAVTAYRDALGAPLAPRGAGERPRPARRSGGTRCVRAGRRRRRTCAAARARGGRLPHPTGPH